MHCTHLRLACFFFDEQVRLELASIKISHPHLTHKAANEMACRSWQVMFACDRVVSGCKLCVTVRICSENNTIESFTQTVCLNRYPNLAFQNRRSTPAVHPRQLHLWRRFLPCTILLDCPDRSRMRNVCKKAFWQRKRNRSKRKTRHLSCKCARAHLLNYLEIAMAKSACDLTRCMCMCVCACLCVYVCVFVYVCTCVCVCAGKTSSRKALLIR